MNSTHAKMVTRALDLAYKLSSGDHPVDRNTLLSLVADFMTTQRPDPDVLAQMLDLVKKGSGGHLYWGKSYPEQVENAATIIRSSLQEGFSTGELKTLFGWTARLLLVRDPEPASPSEVETPEGPRRRTAIKDRPKSADRAKLSDVAAPSVLRLLEKMGKKKTDW